MRWRLWCCRKYELFKSSFECARNERRSCCVIQSGTMESGNCGSNIGTRVGCMVAQKIVLNCESIPIAIKRVVRCVVFCQFDRKRWHLPVSASAWVRKWSDGPWSATNNEVICVPIVGTRRSITDRRIFAIELFRRRTNGQRASFSRSSINKRQLHIAQWDGCKQQCNVYQNQIRRNRNGE